MHRGGIRESGRRRGIRADGETCGRLSRSEGVVVNAEFVIGGIAGGIGSPLRASQPAVYVLKGAECKGGATSPHLLAVAIPRGRAGGTIALDGDHVMISLSGGGGERGGNG